MSQAHPFHIEAFLLDNGTVDTSRYVLKIGRSTLHPGVVSAFITEAIGVDATVTDAKLAHGYTRGSRAHSWVLPTDKIALFNEYLTKFNVMTLVNHLKALRAKMGAKTVKPAKPNHLKVVTDDDYADENPDDCDEEPDGPMVDSDDSDGEEADAN